MSDRPNALQMPPAPGYEDNPLMGGATLADAWDAHRQSYADWLARDRQRQIDMGYLDPQTGQLTPAGWKAQAQIIGGGFGPADVGAVGNALGTIKAYHGSPHSFERFDMSKIGTGEGAQAYGHGMYFAESPEVASSYKKAGPAADAQVDTINAQLAQLSKQMDALSPYGYRKFSDPQKGQQLADEYDALMMQRAKLGHMYEVNLNAEPDQMLHWDKPLSEQSQHVQERLGRVGLAPGGVKERAEYLASLPNDELRAAATRALDSPHDPYGDAWMPTWDTLQKGAPNIDHNAIWDIRVARNSPEGWGYRREGTTGDELYRSLGDPVAAAAALRDAGIPGISYLDAGSRGTGVQDLSAMTWAPPGSGPWGVHGEMDPKTATGWREFPTREEAAAHADTLKSRNHVMFDDATIDIVRRYGIAGLMAGGAATAFGGQDQGNQ